jgi:uncharacterized RDD family membrane protein YckC
MSPEKIPYPELNADLHDEVAARLSSYRARKRRRVEGSMSLNFDGAAAPEMPAPQPPPVRQSRPAEVCNTDFYRRANHEIFAPPEPEFEEAPEELLAPSPEIIADLSSEVLEAAHFSPAPSDTTDVDPFAFEEPVTVEPEPVGLSEPDFAARVVEEPPAPEPPQERRKIIVFPRPSFQPPILEPPRRDELAESIMRSPRILDVPEDVVPTIEGPLFAEVQIESEEEPLSNGPQIEVPLPVAFIGPRVMASAVDIAFVLVASLVFIAMNWSTLWSLPHGKPLFAGLAMLPAALWVLYEYAFMVYCGQTPGMQLLHLRLSSFDGRWPQWRNRRRRAMFTMLSAASLGLGFVWAMVDEDMLCWHDRITQTFVTPEP